MTPTSGQNGAPPRPGSAGDAQHVTNTVNANELSINWYNSRPQGAQKPTHPALSKNKVQGKTENQSEGRGATKILGPV